LLFAGCQIFVFSDLPYIYGVKIERKS